MFHSISTGIPGTYPSCPSTTLSYEVGSTCHLSCNYGYFAANTEEVVCNVLLPITSFYSTGIWSPSDGVACEAIHCALTTLPSVLNGYFDERQCTNSIGDSCNMTCYDGHYPVTHTETHCQLIAGETFGLWLNEIPDYSCQVVGCALDDLPTIQNGFINMETCTGIMVGDTCSVECNEGYHSSSTQCQYVGTDVGTWSNVTCSGSLPHC
ncbi:putative E-selectin-like [Apostichopus japonicus]|uniref:Putative E-selectin-like n=1 Tax=Stichopus japonicus TaxID=307972 RepID=A0A2G8KPT2_STIJA|nr:putative E-selectin-like [Apostichopus japonicus]